MTKTIETEIFRNSNVSVTYYPKREYQKAYFLFQDLHDPWNGTSGYTQKVRGIEKARAYVRYMFASSVADGITFNIIRNVLNDRFKLDVRTYCAID